MYRKANKSLVLFVVMALVCLTLGNASAGPVTQSITYQGKLTNAAGSPLTGTYPVVFSLYEVSVGGTALATSTQSVTSTNGLFTTPVAFDQKYFDARALWLGIKVGSDAEMTPRQEIRPVPYALGFRPGAWITSTGTSSALNLQGTGGGIALNASAKGANSPAVRGESDLNVGIYGKGKEGGYFTTNQAGTGSAFLSAVNVSSVFDKTYGIRINTSADQSRGIYITTNGGLSSGIISSTKGYTSHGITVNTAGESSDGVYALTKGEGSIGLYAETEGNKSAGLWTWTFGDESPGVMARTYGAGSIGIYGQSTDSPGVFGKSTTMDGVTGGSTDLYGVSGYSTNNAGVYGSGKTGVSGIGKEGGYFTTNQAGSPSQGSLAGVNITTKYNYNPGVGIQTDGWQSPGLSARTRGDGSSGVEARTVGANTHGIYAYSSGTGSDGVYGSSSQSNGVTGRGKNGGYFETNDAGGGSGDPHAGIRAETLWTWNPGVLVRTNGGSSYGAWIETQGAFSPAVYAIGRGDHADGIQGYAFGPNSAGIIASSQQSSGIIADTGRADHSYGVETPDKMYAMSFDTTHIDVAEYFPVKGDYGPGTVLVIGAEKTLEESSMAYDTRVAGIVSTAPGMTLGTRREGNNGEAVVAVAGRVPCRVDASSGAIHAGDLLTTSATPGHAMKAEPVNIGGMEINKPGTVLGKAMESLESGTGTIEVLVTLQ